MISAHPPVAAARLRLDRIASVLAAALGGCGTSPPSALPAPSQAHDSRAATPLRAAVREGVLGIRSLQGPRPSIDALCRDVLAGLGAGADARCAADGTGIEEGPHEATSTAAPVRAVRILSIVTGDGSTWCSLAIETAHGHYADVPVAEGHELCGNVGTERVSIDTRALRVEPFTPAMVLWHHVQTWAHQGEDRQRNIETSTFCAVNEGAPPRCLDVDLTDRAGPLVGPARGDGVLSAAIQQGGVIEISAPSKGSEVPGKRRRYMRAAIGTHRLSP
jgi:hypothetical protein